VGIVEGDRISERRKEGLSAARVKGGLVGRPWIEVVDNVSYVAAGTYAVGLFVIAYLEYQRMRAR